MRISLRKTLTRELNVEEQANGNHRSYTADDAVECAYAHLRGVPLKRRLY